MIKYIAYLFFPLLILMMSSNNANADHRGWHVLYAEPDSYCVSTSNCTDKKCRKKRKAYAASNGLPRCKNVDTTTTEPETPICVAPEVLDTVTNTCVTPEPEPPICVEPEVLDTVTNTCVTPEPEPPICVEPEVLDTVTNTCVTPEPEPPICVEPEVLDTVTNTCVTPEPEPPVCVEPEVLDTVTNTCVIPEPEDVVEPPPPPTGDTVTYTIVVNGKSYGVDLIPPTENIDGSTVAAISKYVIYIGDTPDTSSFSFKVDLNTSGSTLISLTPAGVYYMSIVAVDSNGYESDFSNIVELN